MPRSAQKNLQEKPRELSLYGELTLADTELVSGGSAVLIGIGPVVIAAGTGRKSQN